jgi:hypothetical protein
MKIITEYQEISGSFIFIPKVVEINDNFKVYFLYVADIRLISSKPNVFI